MNVRGLSGTEKALLERWRRILPPARPSRHIVELYEQAVVKESAGGGAASWAVLGCTPELRSLAGKYRADILCVDRNQAAYNAFRELCAPSEKEVFLCSDWTELDLREKFDIVFGDGSISMLPLEKHGALLEKIHRMLKPGGLALLRVHLTGEGDFKSPAEVFEWYRKNARDRHIYHAVKQYLNEFCIDPDTMRVSNTLVGNLVRDLHGDGIITSEEFEAFTGSLDGTVEVQHNTRIDFERLVSPLFLIEETHYARDYLNNRCRPLYSLRKKPA